MERTMQTTRRYKRTRQPRRIVLLWLVCLFAAVSFGVLLAISPVAKALLRSEGGPAPAVAPVEGREMPGVIDAPFIDQRDKYPTGCESVTAVMALQYAGVDITVEEFIDNYLPQGNAPYTREDGTLVGADPWKVFLGSPYEESGWGCYAPVITGALEQLLQDRGLEGLSVQELEGESLDKLCREYIDAGTAVGHHRHGSAGGIHPVFPGGQRPAVHLAVSPPLPAADRGGQGLLLLQRPPGG